MQRLMVIGCSGAGKSTFSRKLATATGLPLISLDKEFWQPGWQLTPRLQWRAKVVELAQRESWIMDGTYDSSLDLRLPRADTVIWFRLPRWQCLARVGKRIAVGYGRVRNEMAPACPERLDTVFLKYVWNFNRYQTPNIEQMIAGYGADLSPVIFRRDADAQRFLDSIAPLQKS